MIRYILRLCGLQPRPETQPEQYASIVIRSVAARTGGLDSALPRQVQSAWLHSSGSFELFAAALADLLLDLEQQARQATRSAELFRAQAEHLGDKIIALEMERDARRARVVDERISKLEAELAETQTKLDAAHRRVAELEATLAQERSAHTQRVAQLETDIANLNRIVVERQELIDQLIGASDGPGGWRPPV